MYYSVGARERNWGCGVREAFGKCSQGEHHTVGARQIASGLPLPFVGAVLVGATVVPYCLIESVHAVSRVAGAAFARF